MKEKTAREIAFYTVGALVIALTLYVIYRLFAGEMPQNNHDAIMLVIGAVVGWGTAVVQYYFGSSKGSADKTEQMTNTPKPGAPSDNG